MLFTPYGLPTHSGIYRITNTADGKVYIGQTINLRAHASHHKSMLKIGIEYNTPLQAAYTNADGEGFVLDVLEMCHPTKLTEREQFHMEAHPRRYNKQPAGPSGTLGFKQPPIQKLRHSRSKGGRPFYATSEATGEVLRFEHVGEALAALPHLQRGHVYSCLHGRRYSHAGFVWDYDPTVFPIAPKHEAGRARGPNGDSRAIVSRAPSGAETVFAYPQEAAHAGFSLSAVYDCLAGRKRDYKGLTWHYADGQPHRVREHSQRKNKGPRKHGGSRPIIGLNPVTGASVRFAYIKLAAETLGVFPQNINASIRNAHLGHTAAGFVWRYETGKHEKETPP